MSLHLSNNVNSDAKNDLDELNNINQIQLLLEKVSFH